MTVQEDETTRVRSGEPHREWRSGGGRTAVASALGYGAGPVLFLTTASLFIKPTIAATGWSTTQVLISPWLAMLFAVFGPLAGRACDRKGVKVAAVIGLVPFIVLLVLFATLPLNRAMFYGLAALMGFFGSFAYGVTFNRAVSLWFDKSAGKAFGLVGAGGAAMPFAAIPAVSFAIYTWGWRTGYLMVAAFVLLISLPAVVFGIKTPAVNAPQRAADAVNTPRDRRRYSEVKHILKTPRFWVLVLSVTLATGGASAFLANVQPILLDGGLHVVVATSITTLFSAGVIAGRLGSGALLDLVSRYKVAIGVFAISAAGAISLTRVDALPIAVIAVAALMVAFSQGAEGDVAAYFVLREYDKRHFAPLFSLCFAVTGIGSLSVAYLFAYIVDTTGSYRSACYLGAACYLSAALLIAVFGLIGHRFPRSRPEAQPAEAQGAQ